MRWATETRTELFDKVLAKSAMEYQRGPGWSSRGQKLSQKREEARSTVVTQGRRLKEGATDQGNLLVSCGNKILTVCKPKPSRGEA